MEADRQQKSENIWRGTTIQYQDTILTLTRSPGRRAGGWEMMPSYIWGFADAGGGRCDGEGDA